jgi:hypothetical protein
MNNRSKLLIRYILYKKWKDYEVVRVEPLSLSQV